MSTRRYWTLPALAERWGKCRNTVHYYVTHGLLEAEREDTGSGVPFRVTNKERARFERYVLPNLKPGPKPRSRAGKKADA